MTREEFNKRTLQMQYLDTTMKSMEAFLHAWKKLNSVWSIDHSADIDLNVYMQKMYPFQKSFDDMQFDVALWYADACSRMVESKHDILKTLPHHNDLEEPEPEYKKLSGTKLVSCRVHYEHITVRDDEGYLYFISPSALLSALNEFEFNAMTKRTRTWIEPDLESTEIIHMMSEPEEEYGITKVTQQHVDDARAIAIARAKAKYQTVRVEVIETSKLSVIVEIPADLELSDFRDEIIASEINWDAFEKDADRDMVHLVSRETSLTEPIYTKDQFMNRYFPENEEA